MIIFLKKFGTVLTSRQAGREALSAFLPTLNALNNHENITVDFDGVSALSPSWADEFITPLTERFGNRVTLHKSENASVILTLETLKKFSR